jgi:ABC-type Zn uptake system ZnuABC Zn-binding protein ZnuA
MSLNKDQEDLYKKTMDEVKRQLDGIDEEVEKELQKVRKRLAELQESKKSLRMVMEGTAKLLGIEVEAEENEETDQTQSMAKM